MVLHGHGMSLLALTVDDIMSARSAVQFLDVLVGYPLGRYDTLRVELAPSQLEYGEHLTVVLPHRLDVIPRTVLTTRNGSYVYGGTVGVHYIPISGSPLPAGHYCVIRGQIPAGCDIEL